MTNNKIAHIAHLSLSWMWIISKWAQIFFYTNRLYQKNIKEMLKFQVFFPWFSFCVNMHSVIYLSHFQWEHWFRTFEMAKFKREKKHSIQLNTCYSLPFDCTIFNSRGIFFFAFPRTKSYISYVNSIYKWIAKYLV